MWAWLKIPACFFTCRQAERTYDVVRTPRAALDALWNLIALTFGIPAGGRRGEKVQKRELEKQVHLTRRVLTQLWSAFETKSATEGT